MHVENIAVLDSTYESNAFRTVITNAEPPVENNLSQIAAVGAICNSATFDVGAGVDEKTQRKAIVGNATGQISLFLDSLSISTYIMQLDVAILRFSDGLSSAEVTRHSWIHAYRKSFNPKVSKYMCKFWVSFVFVNL
jgi:sodium/potassium-transporting ATPase subunit alpha